MWQTVQQVAVMGGCRMGLGRTLNDKVMKGYGISSLGGDGFDKLSARATESVRTA
jgi:hypothetical protein